MILVMQGVLIHALSWLKTLLAPQNLVYIFSTIIMEGIFVNKYFYASMLFLVHQIETIHKKYFMYT